MVLWGKDTVHIIGANSPAPTTATPSLFGNTASPSPATGFGATPATGFGTTPATGFGTTPATGFGTNPATQTGGGLFGTTPAPSGGGLFGTTPAPSGGGLFGSSSTAPAPSIFGSTTPAPAFGSTAFGSAPAGGGPFSGGFGSTPAPAGGHWGSAPNPNVPQVPADAALQALQNATARNEEARVTNLIQTLHATYTAGTAADQTGKSHRFSTVAYSPATPQQLQLEAAYGAHSIPIPKPPQITQEDWDVACIGAPKNYVPEALVGAARLQTRSLLQQEQATQIASQVEILSNAAQQLQERRAQLLKHLQYTQNRARGLRLQLLCTLQRTEMLRCWGTPLQIDEWKAYQRLDRLRTATGNLPSKIPPPLPSMIVPRQLAVPDDRWGEVVQQSRQDLTSMTKEIQEHQKDVKLMHDRVVVATASSRPSSSHRP